MVFYNNPNDENPYFCSSKKSIIHSKPKTVTMEKKELGYWRFDVMLDNLQKNPTPTKAEAMGLHEERAHPLQRPGRD